jgi:hypothetical protein
VKSSPSVEFKDVSVRQAVMRLSELKKVEIKEHGAGRRPTVYRLPSK